MSSAAERMRKMRALKAAGVVEFRVTANVDRLALALSEDGILAEWDDDNPKAVEAALNRMIDAYIIQMIGEDVTP